MPRRKREQSPTGIYHVITHGIDRMALFRDDRDRVVFLRLMAEELRQNPKGSVYAWCLMPDHVHLLVRFEKPELSVFMRGLNGRYATYFNSRHGRSGHLFEERFKSESVEGDEHLRVVTRYIHQNPVKVLMTRSCKYRWSSFGEYVGRPFLCDTESVLSVFGGQKSFQEFHRVVALGDRCLEMPLDLSDADAVKYADRILGEGKLRSLKSMKKQERDRVLRTLRACMLPVGQIARLTDFSKSLVYAA